MSTLAAFLAEIGKSIPILFDDVKLLARPILTTLDDSASVASNAIKSAAGVVIDDAAAGAGGISKQGIQQHREHAIVGKLATGSFINKTWIAAAFVAAASVAPVIPQILLGLGGAYLAYEGAHKALEAFEHSALGKKIFNNNDDHSTSHLKHNTSNKKSSKTQEKLHQWSERNDPLGALTRMLGVDANERWVVADLLILDAVLSAEIILVAMGTLPADATLSETAIALCVVNIATTALVYIPILGILRSDNVADRLIGTDNTGPAPKLGQWMNNNRPKFISILSFIGVAAMLEVGGGILVHKLPEAFSAVGGNAAGEAVHHALEGFIHLFGVIPFVGEIFAILLIGLAAGATIMGAKKILATIQSMKKKK